MRQAGSASLLLVMALVACDGADPPAPSVDPPAGAQPDPASAPAASAAPAEPGMEADLAAWGGSVRLSYACSDGSTLQVRFGHYDATIHLADGTTATLARAESASTGGIDAYFGGGITMQREGRSVRLTRPGRSLSCHGLGRPD
jgi:hypothetical protein